MNNFRKNSSYQYLLIILPLSILAYLSYLNRAYQVDDALIYQRYIQNFLDGHGLVYNQGEFLNALTSPLYTYLSLVSAWLLNNSQTGAIILSSLLMGASLVVFSLVFSRYIPIIFAVLGALFTSAFPYFYHTYGMESSLFVFLIGLSLYFFEKHNHYYLGISLALLLITRSEGVFLVLAMFIEHLRLRRSFPELKCFIVPCLIISASLGFNYFYYGSFLAETGKAKIYQGMSGLWGEWPAFANIDYQINWFFQSNWMMFYGIIIPSILGIIALGKNSLNIVIFLFLSFYSLFYISLNIPNYHWYYSPYYLFIFFYLSVFIFWLYTKFKESIDIKFKVLGYTSLLLASSYLSINSIINTMNSSDFGSLNKPYREVGLWLKNNTPKDSKIALVEIGHVGYYSERHIIDILGLVNKFNAKYIGELKLSNWLLHYSPDYILIHAGLWPHETGVKAAVLLGDFVTTSMRSNKLEVMQKKSLQVNFLPDSISEPNQLRIEDNKYVLMVHAPGEAVFSLAAGDYDISGEFGLIRETYTQVAQPTDGVIFQLTQNQEVIYQRTLNPLENLADQSIQKFHVSMSIDKQTQLKLNTLTNGHSFNDWSFWRNIKITAHE